ncbi:MAG: hypothetical protein AAF962_26710 [Actinomycetota bacterium]
MSPWQDEPLVSNRLDDLRALVGRRVAAFERYAFRGYTHPGHRGSEKAFELGEGLVAVRFVEHPAIAMFWGHESACTLGLSVHDESSSESFEHDEFELIATSDDFPEWRRVRNGVIVSCGLIDWNRSAGRQGYPEGGVYLRLADGPEVLIAYQLVSQAEDLLLHAGLSPHLKAQLRYIEAG